MVTTATTNGTRGKLLQALITIGIIYLGVLSYRAFIETATKTEVRELKTDMTCALEKIDKKLDTLIWRQLPRPGGHD